MSIQVGDMVRRKPAYQNHNGWPLGDKVVKVVRVTDYEIYVEGNGYSWVQEYFDKVTSKSFGSARSNDPATSKKAAKVKRVSLRESILIDLTAAGNAGLTGHEAALKAGGIHKLNSVTPRFAELRRAQRIKDSGLRRDGQIVWVAA